jgi:phosphoglycerate kinase
MRSIRELKSLRGKTALVRVDFNVPIRGGKILDDYRIKKSLPTINLLLKKGARIILISHLGKESGNTLKPVMAYLGKLRLKNVVLLENLRLNSGEENNSKDFAKQLARLVDPSLSGQAGIYVNDAFPVCHRNHSSIVTLPKLLPSYAGLQLEEEVKNLKSAFNPSHPFLFILGGAKFGTKIPLIKKFIKIADGIFIGGALMNNFFKEAGMDVGKSLVDKKNFGLKKLMKNEKIILPVDVVIKDKSFVDIGKKSVAIIEEMIKNSRFVLMNGPMGNYEKGFGKATEAVIKALAKSKAKTIVGGGDTVALISKLKLEKKLGFVSTGGGATLEFLSKGTLPGIRALS